MIDAFLAQAGWAKASRTPLAGDASARRYTRLTDSARSSILMEDSNPQSLAAFRRIGTHLRNLGLSAPKELAAAPNLGLLLIEDLGDLTLSRLLQEDAATADMAYRTTADLLVHLAKTPPPDELAAPGPDEMAQMVGLTFDLLQESGALRTALLGALSAALAHHAPGPPTLSLRDVHADNLMWLPHRTGLARIGLLDYQDALLLPDGYDLASLLDDPRREVPAPIWENLVEDYARINVLSLQRNLRILGIFHRLATQLGKPHYAAFLPRTRALIRRAAADMPTLATPVSELLDRTAHWGAP